MKMSAVWASNLAIPPNAILHCSLCRVDRLCPALSRQRGVFPPKGAQCNNRRLRLKLFPGSHEATWLVIRTLFTSRQRRYRWKTVQRPHYQYFRIIFLTWERIRYYIRVFLFCFKCNQGPISVIRAINFIPLTYVHAGWCRLQKNEQTDEGIQSGNY